MVGSVGRGEGGFLFLKGKQHGKTSVFFVCFCFLFLFFKGKTWEKQCFLFVFVVFCFFF